MASKYDSVTGTTDVQESVSLVESVSTSLAETAAELGVAYCETPLQVAHQADVEAVLGGAVVDDQLGAEVAAGPRARRRDAPRLAPLVHLVESEVNVKAVRLTDDLEMGALGEVAGAGEDRATRSSPPTNWMRCDRRSRNWRSSSSRRSFDCQECRCQAACMVFTGPLPFSRIG